MRAALCYILLWTPYLLLVTAEVKLSGLCTLRKAEESESLWPQFIHSGAGYYPVRVHSPTERAFLQHLLTTPQVDD